MMEKKISRTIGTTSSKNDVTEYKLDTVVTIIKR
jgi:hypothetical protein